MTRDYYGRFINLPTDHPDQPDELDDDQLDDDPGPIEAAENDAFDWPDWDDGRCDDVALADAAEDRWLAERERAAFGPAYRAGCD